MSDFLPSDSVGSSTGLSQSGGGSAVSSANRMPGRSALVLTALEDLRRAASSATAAVAVANGGSKSADHTRALDGDTFSPNFSASHAAAGFGSGPSLHRSDSGRGVSSGEGSMLRASGPSSVGAGGSNELQGGDGSDGGRSRRNVSFSGQAQVQQFHKNEIVSSERQHQQQQHYHHQQQRQQQQEQQQHNIQQLHHNTFIVPEPPPRKR